MQHTFSNIYTQGSVNRFKSLKSCPHEDNLTIRFCNLKKLFYFLNCHPRTLNHALNGHDYMQSGYSLQPVGWLQR
jgi:hypothetical protein